MEIIPNDEELRPSKRRETADLRPGDRFGDCVVRRQIGRGAMGVVYLVVDPAGAEYALKIVDPGAASDDDEYRRRFVREAEFAMGIRHRNLITVHDAGENHETGVCYILMDYMPGGSLSDLLAKRGPLPVDEAVSIAAHIAFALETAHRRDIVHRDIKPDNILFAADGTPRLADLGVAKFADDAKLTMMTTEGMIVGTPAYMAPEQLMDSHGIDARADIYSLGVVLYEMLTNRRPNEGVAVMGLLAKAIRGDSIPDVRELRPEVSASVACVLAAMCAPRPEDRPRTAGAVADLLVRAGSDSLLLVGDGEGEGAPAAEKVGVWRRLFGRKGK